MKATGRPTWVLRQASLTALATLAMASRAAMGWWPLLLQPRSSERRRDEHPQRVYRQSVVNNVTVNRVSLTAGRAALRRDPTAREQAVDQQRHIPPVAAQTQHIQAARSIRRCGLRQPRQTAGGCDEPSGEISGQGVVAAKAEGAPYHPAPAWRNATARASRPAAEAQCANGLRRRRSAPRMTILTHARDLPPHQVQTNPSSGNTQGGPEYQKQQQKLVNQQNKEHQKLQQQQEKEDQQISETESRPAKAAGGAASSATDSAAGTEAPQQQQQLQSKRRPQKLHHTSRNDTQ